MATIMNKINYFPLDNIFREKGQYLDYVFNIYDKIYELKNIKYEGKVSEELFNYVLKRKYFVLLVIYDENHKIYLERNVQDELYWSLPGGSVRTDEDIHTAIRRISERISLGPNKTVIGEIEPIAFVTNKFSYKDQTFSHYGIAFIARVRNKNKLNIDDSTGSFVYSTPVEIKKINRYANKEVVKLALIRLKNYISPPPEEEVFTNEKYNFRYMIHNQFMKRFILTDRLKKKQQFIDQIKSLIGPAKKYIDVSCGDSNLIQKLANNDFEYIVANDISWSQIKLAGNKDPRIIFTNHNSQYLPFQKNSFDVAYCGNTLHHMGSKKELLDLFSSLMRVSKKIIIVEIEHPKETGLIPYLLNRYWYVGFLRDVGGSFFTKKDFESVITSYFSDLCEVKFKEFNNIQGRYLVAEIDKKNLLAKENKNKVLEIEYKYKCSKLDFLLDKCRKIGFVLKEQTEEKDGYLTDISGKFIKNRTCLRIRSSGQSCELTFKGKSMILSGVYAKEEHNLPLDITLRENYFDILFSLGFYRYVEVDKKRTVYSLEGSKYVISIAIDEIKNVGSFVEFEAIADAEEYKNRREKIQKELLEFIRKFKISGLTEASLPYRDYVAGYLADNVLKKQQLKAILFDFDGTIIPSEEMFFAAYRKIAKEVFNRDITIEEYIDNELNKNSNLIKYLNRKSPEKLINNKEFIEKVYQEYDGQLDKLLANENLIVNLKAIELLKNKGYKLALVSTSKRQFIGKVLNYFKMNKLFDVVIAREDVKNLKPDPQAYLEALEKLGITFDQCLAIEDSNRGAKSAQKAKVNCVLVKNNSLYSKYSDYDSNLIIFNYVIEIIMLLLYA